MTITIKVTTDAGDVALDETLKGFTEAELTEPGEGTISLFGVLRRLLQHVLKQGGHT